MAAITLLSPSVQWVAIVSRLSGIQQALEETMLHLHAW